jgi:hypothetical protein
VNDYQRISRRAVLTGIARALGQSLAEDIVSSVNEVIE